jgi:hypothetical protein
MDVFDPVFNAGKEISEFHFDITHLAELTTFRHWIRGMRWPDLTHVGRRCRPPQRPPWNHLGSATKCALGYC